MKVPNDERVANGIGPDSCAAVREGRREALTGGRSTSDPGSGTLTILSGATFNDQTTSARLNITANNFAGDTGASAAVNNAGTFIKSGSAVSSTISTLFNNSGIVDVQSGTLRLSGGGTDVGGTYRGAGTVNFSGGAHTLDATTNGLLTVTSGTATFNGTVIACALMQSGGEFNGSGTLTATGVGRFRVGHPCRGLRRRPAGPTFERRMVCATFTPHLYLHR